MRRVGLGILVVGIVLAVALFSQPASAHVLIKSANSESAAILHIMPDDDPIAGEKATLMFDTQGELLQSDSKVTLIIANKTSGKSETVPTTIDGSLVSASYIFAAQGLYSIRYEIKTNGVTVLFEQSQRVSRGAVAVGSNSSNVSYSWAEALLFIAIVFVILLGILAWNHRKAIFKSSKL